jgi:hypothetical protein
MLLIGMWINFTKKPMKPIMAKPIAVAMAIFWNSENKVNKFSSVNLKKWTFQRKVELLFRTKSFWKLRLTSSGPINEQEKITFSVWFGTPLDQPDGILGELLHWLNVLNNLIHLACRFWLILFSEFSSEWLLLPEVGMKSVKWQKIRKYSSATWPNVSNSKKIKGSKLVFKSIDLKRDKNILSRLIKIWLFFQ